MLSRARVLSLLAFVACFARKGPEAELQPACVLSPTCSTTGHITWQIVYAPRALSYSYVKCMWPWKSPLTSLDLIFFKF